MMRKLHLRLLDHDEGVSVRCPELPGCHSQGATIAKTMGNIRDAIEGCMELYGEPAVRCQVREMEVAAR
jgi:predicted RNase H-like HicB family nuclease